MPEARRIIEQEARATTALVTDGAAPLSASLLPRLTRLSFGTLPLIPADTSNCSRSGEHEHTGWWWTGWRVLLSPAPDGLAHCCQERG